jgi:hypothetical protein
MRSIFQQAAQDKSGVESHPSRDGLVSAEDPRATNVATATEPPRSIVAMAGIHSEEKAIFLARQRPHRDEICLKKR